jgi:16S rRNA processing protein RimM
MAADKRVLLGHIRGAHGIRGDVTIQTYTVDPAAIGTYGPLSDEVGKRTFEITSVRVTAKGVIAQIKDVVDRTAAEALRGTALYVARAALPDAAEGDYYHADLVGLSVRTTDGNAMGKVVAVQNFGAGDLLEVQLTGTKRTELFPFTDACVPTVDIAAGHVVIMPPPTIEATPDEQKAEREANGG